MLEALRGALHLVGDDGLRADIPRSSRWDLSLHQYVLSNMFVCMRTTINLNDRLFQDLKRHAAKDGSTMGRLIEDAVRAYLRSPKPREGYALQWRTERGRLLPGVRLDDRDSLFDRMEGRD